ncbi:hypothetical protein NSPZN2_40174 [Nitrospira defluvii]|uniref:Uncharacterized protein n=1 Tax=Nitrospira defluvii TaxID=330214 RepID=A0ABM8RS50_9BACT|nr:hypothetical protein NSPZN2_40174 [Nitrospira defluvii]
MLSRYGRLMHWNSIDEDAGLAKQRAHFYTCATVYVLRKRFVSGGTAGMRAIRPPWGDSCLPELRRPNR